MSTANLATTYQLYVGVDISAATFTVARMRPDAKPNKALDYQQTHPSFSKFQQDLLPTDLAACQILIVMEATGTYWISLALFLVQAGFAVAVINPMQAHN